MLNDLQRPWSNMPSSFWNFRAVALLAPVFIIFSATGALAADIVVIGAGASGLKSALDLCSKGYSVTVLESRNRTGGRVFTTTIGEGGDAVKTEVGAGWLHGSGKFRLNSSLDWRIIVLFEFSTVHGSSHLMPQF